MAYDDFDDVYDDPYYHDDFEDAYENSEAEVPEKDEVDSDNRYPLSTWEEMAFLGGMAEEMADVRRAKNRQERELNDFKRNQGKYRPRRPMPLMTKRPGSQSKYGDLIYIDSRGVGVPPPSRVMSIQEAISGGYPVLIDYIDTRGNYYKEIKIRPKRIFDRNGVICFETIENKLLDLAGVYFLSPMSNEKRIPVKAESIGKKQDKGVIDLFYFLPNYDTGPFDYMVDKLCDLSKIEIENPSQELISLCKEIKRKAWVLRYVFKNYKVLLDAICEDIKHHNPDLNPDIAIKIRMDECPPEEPGLTISWQFEKR